jgi:hypothetical protein
MLQNGARHSPFTDKYMQSSRRVLLLIIFLIFALISCKKNQNYPTDSVYGPWFCIEEGQGPTFKQYNVNISYDKYDESQIFIYNFHNIGISSETTAIIQDTLITILFNDSFLDISGTGHVKRDYSAIYWEYNYNGQFFSAIYKRP